MNKILCMTAFVNVVQTGGFSSAGRKIGIATTLISRYIAQLEDDLGVLLLQRTTRKVTTTQVGFAYYQRCLPLLDEISELESMVKLSHVIPHGKLVLSAPTSFSEIHLMPVLSEFIEQYPEVTIDLQLTDRFVDIIEEGVDIALRIGNLSDSSLIARKIIPITLVTCASEKYLNQAPLLREPNDLAEHRCIIDSNFKNGKNWLFQKGTQEIEIEVKSAIQVNSVRAVRELLLMGSGIGICPLFAVDDDIKNGRLSRVLKSYETNELGLYAVYSHRRHLSAKVRLFIDLMVKHFSTNSSR